MNPQQSSDGPIDYSKPVAYDTNGQPLYAHPPATTPETPPIIPAPVANPAVTPPPQAASELDEDVRHDASKKAYPQLNLSQGEYVIEECRRHPIGLFPIVGAAGTVGILGLLTLIFYPTLTRSMTIGTYPPFGSIILPILTIVILAALLAYLAYFVYISNRLFLTNESVIDETQTSLFAHQERTVSLANIEEVTFSQDSLIQNWFNYGTLRMTIEGDHIAYEFPYMGDPKRHVDLIVNTIEVVKPPHHRPKVTQSGS